MPHRIHIREKAVRLRADQGLTIDEIADRLAVSRSTVYHWVRDMPIERDPARRSAAQRRAAQANAARARAKRRAAHERGRLEYPALSRDPTFRDFVCMYVGEGYKKNRNIVSISNSDPTVVSLSTLWIDRLTPRMPRFALQYHADQDPEWLRQFWGFRLGSEPGRISLQRKSNSGQLRGRNWRSRFGVLTVTAHDTMLRARIQAWIDETKRTWVRD